MQADEGTRTSLDGSRVTCGTCAVRDNEVVVCTLTKNWRGVRATCPVCGHSEIVRPK